MAKKPRRPTTKRYRSSVRRGPRDVDRDSCSKSTHVSANSHACPHCDTRYFIPWCEMCGMWCDPVV